MSKHKTVKEYIDDETDATYLAAALVSVNKEFGLTYKEAKTAMATLTAKFRMNNSAANDAEVITEYRKQCENTVKARRRLSN